MLERPEIPAIGKGITAMDIGVFIPINNNGWLISENAPQYMPSFELNKIVAQKAEDYGMDFALSMIKLHGFGGKTEFQIGRKYRILPIRGAACSYY